MLSTFQTKDDKTNNRFIKIEFGDVPVGSVHKKSISITNDLKKVTTFKVKNNNESMYLADSISFEPSITAKIFPNKKTTFLITFSPKSVHIQTTLEYFTIFSIDDQIETMYDEFDDFEYENNNDVEQKIIVCVQGSCYGPSIKPFPTKVFIHQSGDNKQTIKSINLINSSKMPGQYQVQYDCENSLLKCYPPFGIVKKHIQIKLELKPCQIEYYYKRLYILIANHHPIYIDVYVFPSKATTMNPFSYFRTPFELPKSENNYVDFFKDLTHYSIVKQIDVFPKELHFGYVNNTKTLSFNVYNNSKLPLFINWICGTYCNNIFTINPKRFYIDSHETKILQCEFRPKITTNIYFFELEATVHFDPDISSSNYVKTSKLFPAYIIPINISITVTGYSFKKPFNGHSKLKCKLSSHVIIMPPSMPASKPVFTTFFIKNIAQVPTTFEFQPPNKSVFLVKPKCGVINGDYQIVVFQLLKTNIKESLYAERWHIVFDFESADNYSVSIDIYASVEFGCVMIGQKNYICIPNEVQVGCEINTQVPIINMTRHRLHYYLSICDQQPKTEIKSEPSLSSSDSSYIELETEEIEKTKCRYINTLQNYETTDSEYEQNEISAPLGNNVLISFAESTQLLDVLKNWNAGMTSDQSKPPLVFEFDKLTGELEPNEKLDLNLLFCPLECVLYTVNAKCYIICNEFPEIVNILPIVIKGRGCKTEFKITPANCNLIDTIINTERIQHVTIKNTNYSYANIKFTVTPMESNIFWNTPTCKISPDVFQFTPHQNICKINLTIHPTELGFQKFFINIHFESKVKYKLKNENIITVSMNVITCALQITRITNDCIPYFGKLTLNKLFHNIKINQKLSKVHTKNKAPLILTMPIVSELNVFEFQLYNSLKIPINWTLKYNKCIKCSTKINNKNINKCIHYKSIQMHPTVNLKMENFSKIQIELNDIINKDKLKLSYQWLSGFNKTILYNTELLIESKTFKDDLISFDPKCGTSEHLEFNFIPIFIAHPNPPAQAFWVYNSNNYNINYLIIDDSLTPAYPYFNCLNPSGTVNSKSVHPILFVFSPDKLSKFEATVMLLSNNKRRNITLLGKGESYTRTTISPGPGLSSFLPTKNDRDIFLSSESIILKPIFTCSNIKFLICLYNESNEEIMYEWKECRVEKILNAIVKPFKGNIKGHESQVFEITITSYNQPATLTIMFNVSYKLVSREENYKTSLRNYNNNKNKLEGVFIINEYGNFKPKLNMKLENHPQEKHLVLYVCVRINDEFNSRWLSKLKNNRQILEQKPQWSDDFQNILWSVIDNICSKKIECKLLYYYQLRNSKNNSKEISKTNKNNLKCILTKCIIDSLINIYPLDVWKY